MAIAYSKLDQFLIELQQTLLTPRAAYRTSPAADIPEAALSVQEKNFCASLMRVNHTGEICAQALYLGQALVAKEQQTRAHLLLAADEEADHLAWCLQRLHELDASPSKLNLAFFSLSLLTGMLAGLASDKTSLGFIAETEHQVAEHLSQHLATIPAHDHKSRAIITQMQIDEVKHQVDAIKAGGASLHPIIAQLMRASARMMTSTTYYI